MLKFLFPDLRERAQEQELMDLPDSSGKKLFNTLRQFSFSNFWLSRARRLLTRIVLADMRREPARPYTLLDLGAGSCDLPRWLLRICEKQGLKIRITCLELDPRTAAYAREKCRPFPAIEVLEGSALSLASFPAYDYIFANHFLHHLPSEQIPSLLDQVARKTRRRFLLNDIRRSRWAYLGFTFFAGLWARNSFTFYDGRLSIRKGFTPGEMQALLARSLAGGRTKLLLLPPARVALDGAGTELME